MQDPILGETRQEILYWPRGERCDERREGGHLGRTAREGLDLRREAKLAGCSAGSTIVAKNWSFAG